MITVKLRFPLVLYVSLCSECNSLWTTEGTQSVSVPGQWEGECKFGYVTVLEMQQPMDYRTRPVRFCPGTVRGEMYVCKQRALNGQWHALVSV